MITSESTANQWTSVIRYREIKSKLSRPIFSQTYLIKVSGILDSFFDSVDPTKGPCTSGGTDILLVVEWNVD